MHNDVSTEILTRLRSLTAPAIITNQRITQVQWKASTEILPKLYQTLIRSVNKTETKNGGLAKHAMFKNLRYKAQNITSIA